MPQQAKTTYSKRKDALKRRSRLNKRAISTVLATVFFLGIAISVALTLFLMSSSYNNLYQQQLDVRQQRLEERLQVLGWKSSVPLNFTTNKPNPVPDFMLYVKNTGTISIHVVSVYVNDTLVWNDPTSAVWITPLGAEWTPLINSELNWKVSTHVGDNVTVSTERGNIAVSQITKANYLGAGGDGGHGGSETTPYAVQVHVLNPQGLPGTANPHAADQVRYFFWVVWDGSLNPAYPEDSLYPPGVIDYTDPKGMNYTSVNSAEGFVGVFQGRFIIWVIELQYQSGVLQWSRMGPADTRPLDVTIPEDAETYVWVANVILGDVANPPSKKFDVKLTTSPKGPNIKVANNTILRIDAWVNVSGAATATGCEGYKQNLIVVYMTLSGTGRYEIVGNSEGTTGAIIFIPVVENGESTSVWWQLLVTGSADLTIKVSGRGECDNAGYTDFRNLSIDVTK
jgi:hypothetical protein